MSHRQRMHEFIDEFCRRVGFRPTTEEITWLLLKEIHDMNISIDQVKADLATMAGNLNALATSVPSLVGVITSQQAQIAALVAAGAGATPEQLADLDATINSENTTIATAQAAANAVLNPAPASDTPAPAV